MALPHGTVGWSAVCDCGISRSYSLTFCICSGCPHARKLCVFATRHESCPFYFEPTGKVHLECIGKIHFQHNNIETQRGAYNGCQ